MKQMSFFDMIGAKTLDAAQHEKNVKEAKKRNAQATNEKRKAAAEKPKEVEQPKSNEPLAPTWEINFFDVDLAERIAWYRDKGEDGALAQCRKQYKGLKLVQIRKSDRTLEEIEALD